MEPIRWAKITGRSLLIIMWVTTLGIALVWVFSENPPFNPEPVTVVLGLTSTAVTALYNEFIKLLEKEEYSIVYALAYGYVNNFLEPAITKILKGSVGKNQDLRFYLFIPEDLNELTSQAIDRTMARIRARNYQSSIINLDFGEGRTRDVINLLKKDELTLKYFDFPNTLTTLSSLIEYKLETSKNRSPEQGKRVLSTRYITGFRKEVERLCRNRGLMDYIEFTNKELEFLNNFE